MERSTWQRAAIRSALEGAGRPLSAPEILTRDTIASQQVLSVGEPARGRCGRG